MKIESSNYNNNDEISLNELILKFKGCLKYLLSKWILILIFGLAGGILGVVYALIKRPVYTATTTFVLEDEKSMGGSLGSLAGLASMAGVDLGSGGGGIFQGDNILELYKSRTMIEKALFTSIECKGKKQLLIDRYIDFNNLKKTWQKNPELLKINFSLKVEKQFGRLQDSIIGTIVQDINKNYLEVAKPDKKLNIIKADVKSSDEFFAKSFNDEIVKNVNDFYIQTKTKKSLDNVRILQQKTDSVRAVMNGAIYSAAEITDATPNLNPTRQAQRIAPVQRAQFSAETNKNILGELVKNLELSKMSLLKETPLVQVIDKPIYPLEVKKIGLIKGSVLGIILTSFLSIFFFALRFMFKKMLDDGSNKY